MHECAPFGTLRGRMQTTTVLSCGSHAPTENSSPSLPDTPSPPSSQPNNSDRADFFMYAAKMCLLLISSQGGYPTLLRLNATSGNSAQLAHVGMPCSRMILHRPQDIIQRCRVCRVCYHVLQRQEPLKSCTRHQHADAAWHIQAKQPSCTGGAQGQARLARVCKDSQKSVRQMCTLSCCTAFGRHPTSMNRMLGFSYSTCLL